MDYSIPTGSDILSYRGDPGLASGADGGLSPIQVNPLAGTDSALDKIEQVNAQKSLLSYKQKQQDQEDLAKMLMETGGSVFNMKGANGQNMSYTPLPDDQKILTDKAHELRRMVLKNPDNYQFNEDYLDKRKEYDNLVNHAGVRASAYSTYNGDAAKTNDPDERRAILAMRDAEIGGKSLNEFHMPEPHLPALQVVDPISAKDWTDKKKMQQFGTAISQRKDAAGNNVGFEVSRYGIPNNEILAPLNDVSTPGIEYIKNVSTGFMRLPQSQDPAYITAMNANIDKKAAQRGITPIYAATVTPDGKVKFNSGREIAAALNLEKHGGLQAEEKTSDAAIKQRKEEQDIVKSKADVEKEENDMRKAWADLGERTRHDKAMENKDGKGGKPTAEQLKEDQHKHAALGAYDDVHTVFDGAFKQPVVTKQYPEFWQRHGIDPKQYTFYADVPQKKADAFIGIPADDESTTTKEDGKTTVSKSASVSKTPDRVVPIKDNATGERKMVYVKGNDILAVVDERNAIVNKLKHEAQYDPKQYENQTAWVNDFYSGAKDQSASAPATHTPTGPQTSFGLNEVTQRITEGNKKIAVVNGKRYEVVGKTKEGKLVAVPIE